MKTETHWSRDRRTAGLIARNDFQLAEEYIRLAYQAQLSAGINTAILRDHRLTLIEASYAQAALEEVMYGSHNPCLEVFE